MQHRFGRERGFIIRNANREAAALRVPPVFEGAAHINDDAALTTTLRRRPACIGAAARTSGAVATPATPSMSLSHAAARASRASEQPPSRRPTTAQPLLCRRLPWSQTPDLCLTLQPYASQILTFRPFPIKPHEFFIGKG